MFEPEPLVFSEEELKTIFKVMSKYVSVDAAKISDRINQHLNECRLARNPEVIASLRKSMQDIKEGNIKKVQLREREI